ncbi:MAG: hypothetical protein IT305_00965 [Chloroflexi bacterium]|nr:hypothetical protein [Chloroflexota bacterium]
MIVGNDQARYELAEGWERLPAEWSHGDAVGVAVDAQDRVYVFNRGQYPMSPEHPVIVYDRDGRFQRSFGDGLFRSPHGIALDAAGNIYCVDNGDHTVRKFTPAGELLLTIGTRGVPSDTGYTTDYRTITHGGPPFNMPTNVAVAPSGDLFVSDGYGNARVHRFGPDGILRASWGGPGDGPGQFNVPHAIRVHPDGRLLVCDRENSRVQIFDEEGRFLDQWTDLARPDDLHIDRDGRVYVAELGERAGFFPFMSQPLGHNRPGRVSVLDPDGQVLVRWGGDDPYAAGSFFAPHGIAVDSHGDVYVSEVTYSAGGNQGMVPPDCHTLQKFVRVE